MKTDFRGTATPLADGDIGKIAHAIGVETAVLLAFLEVEANGRGFDGKGRPKILFEPHVFWRELGPGDKRTKAVSAGLAYQKWGSKPYPTAFDQRFAQLAKAMEIDANKALRSASWGAPQIMGFNHKAAGYSTVQAMVEAFMASEANQIAALGEFLRSEGIDKLLRGKDFTKAESWEPAVRKYNGPGYAANKYHIKAAKAYAKYAAKGAPMQPTSAYRPAPATGALSEGMQGGRVTALQMDLNAMGIVIATDGKYGPETVKAVRFFQEAAGLPVTGAADVETIEKLAFATFAANENTTPPAPPNDREPIRLGRIVGVVAALIALAAVAWVVTLGGPNGF
jgi:hypothetical protein